MKTQQSPSPEQLAEQAKEFDEVFSFGTVREQDLSAGIEVVRNIGQTIGQAINNFVEAVYKVAGTRDEYKLREMFRAVEKER